MRNKYFLRPSALSLALMILLQTLWPTVSMALTSGPSQPEVQGFQPIGTSDMVNLFTGDFSYNIPLGEVDGYPINLSYQADPRMEQEASWVGLGWSLNPGAINREVRGLPDDFNGDEIERDFNLRDNKTTGGKLTVGGAELFGLNIVDFSLGFGAYYNNYRGYGTELNISPTFNLHEISSSFISGKKVLVTPPMQNPPGMVSSQTPLIDVINMYGGEVKSIDLGLNLGFDSGSGFDFSISPIYSSKSMIGYVNVKQHNINFSTGYNSRQGLKYIAAGMSRYKYGAKISNFNTGHSIGFAGFTYTPVRDMPIKNNSGTFSLALGPTIIGLSAYVGMEGYGAVQSLSKHYDAQASIGYLYQGTKPKSDIYSLMDYNRSRIALHKEVPVLPAPFATYDLFNVSGQGTGGQFRVMRTDFGLYRPAFSENKSTSVPFSLELAMGNVGQIGGALIPAKTSSQKTIWNQLNRMHYLFDFEENKNLKEAVFFALSGGNPHTTPSFIKQNTADAPFSVALEQTGNNGTIKAKSEIHIQDGLADNTLTAVALAPNTPFVTDNRYKRNQILSYLTVKEAKHAALLKEHDASDDTEGYRKDHHLSELSVTQVGGTRHVYGLAAYNNRKEELSFNISTQPNAIGKQLATYANNDNSIANSKGVDHFFDRTTTPAYAYSYLLTSVLSPDYVDITGDGISDDDLGNAVKFDYSRLYKDFKWRMPIASTAKSANYSPGYLSYNKDDKASYTYGEKEIWYLTTIEGRTMHAKFIVSNRADALGVQNEDGVIANKVPLKKLDKIQFFTKSELINNPTKPVPLKTVHFEYDYTLCENIPNFNANYKDAQEEGTGKLTLKKVYFTYGKSDRGAINAYHFDYKGEGESAFNYDINSVNRWGLLQKNEDVNLPSNVDFPYASQNETYINATLGAWNLNQIELPSGGIMNIAYESDDYAYVQDKRAGQMFMIAGFTDEVGGNTEHLLYKEDNDVINKFLVIDNIEAASLEEAKLKYLEDVKQLYFQCKIHLKRDGAVAVKEWLKGYLTFNKNNVAFEDGKLYIPLNELDGQDINRVHPITFAGIQLMRLERPELAYQAYETEHNANEGLVTALVNMFDDLGNVFRGFVKNSVRKEWCDRVDLDESWVRLSNPKFKKYGGGTRVSQMTISDEWNIENDGGSSVYGQEYIYETQEDVNGLTQDISSGVAAYEPLIGGEENLMRNAITFDEKRKLAPNNIYYVESPVGESLYPAPVVGYSKVLVKNLDHEGLKGLGHTTHEYYTAKDFPLIEKRTKLDRKHDKPNPILNFILKQKHEALAMSQGISVEVNDMHGKMKSVKTYDAMNSLLNASTYSYRLDQNETGEPIKHLNNTVSLMAKDGTIASGDLGYNMETWLEMADENSATNSLGVSVNSGGFLLGIFPLPWWMPIPTKSSASSSMKTSSVTKFIQRFGIVDKVSVMENGSTLTTENLIYDEQTGDVLLTKTQNEFKDAMYSFNYPAHWAYEGMGSAYKNINAVVSLNVPYVAGQSSIPFVLTAEQKEFFHPGDELLISGQEDLGVHWIVADPDDNYLVMDRAGELFQIEQSADGAQTEMLLKVIRSGRRNLASTAIAAVSSRLNPAGDANDVAQDLALDASKEVINATAVAFSEDWKMRCEESFPNGSVGTPMLLSGEVVNPYVVGLKGHWRPESSYAFYNARDNAALSGALTTDNTIREKGTLPNFTPYWDFVGNVLSPQNSPQWVKSNRISLYDQRGNELENEDALGVYSAALYGYNQSLATAVVANAQHKEIVFDGFEDYNYASNFNIDPDAEVEPAFRNLWFKREHGGNTGAEVTQEAAHSGKYALSIGTLKPFEVHIASACVENSSNPGGGEQTNIAPIARFYQEHSNNNNLSCPVIGLNASLSYDPDGTIDTYHWLVRRVDVVPNQLLFNGTGETIPVFFEASATYDIKLTVTDNSGTSDIVQVTHHSPTQYPVTCATLNPNGGTPTVYTGGEDNLSLNFDEQEYTYINTCYSCLNVLEPQAGQTYLLSLWAANESSVECGKLNEDLSPSVEITNTTNDQIASYSFQAAGPVIEGWQRYELKLEVPIDYKSAKIVFDNTNAVEQLYVDDFRFHPFDANMQSYVYDSESLRLAATLDENNYATFYEYDDEGLLVRVKRETERGVMTVQESRTVLKQNNLNE